MPCKKSNQTPNKDAVRDPEARKPRFEDVYRLLIEERDSETGMASSQKLSEITAPSVEDRLAKLERFRDQHRQQVKEWLLQHKNGEYSMNQLWSKVAMQTNHFFFKESSFREFLLEKLHLNFDHVGPEIEEETCLRSPSESPAVSTVETKKRKDGNLETTETKLERNVYRDIILNLLERTVLAYRNGEMSVQAVLGFATDVLMLRDEVYRSFKQFCEASEVNASDVARRTWKANVSGNLNWETEAIRQFSLIYSGTDSDDDEVPDWNGSLQGRPFQCLETLLRFVSNTIKEYRDGLEDDVDFMVRAFFSENLPTNLELITLCDSATPADDVARNLWNSFTVEDDREMVLQGFNSFWVENKVNEQKEALESKASKGDDFTEGLPKGINNSTEDLPKDIDNSTGDIRKAETYQAVFGEKSLEERKIRAVAEKVKRRALSLPKAWSLLEKFSESPQELWRKMYKSGVDPVYFFGPEIIQATGISVSSRWPLLQTEDRKHPLHSRGRASDELDSPEEEDSEGLTEGLWGLKMPRGDAKKIAHDLNLEMRIVDRDDSKLKKQRRAQEVRRLIMGEETLDMSRSLVHTPTKRRASIQLSSSQPKRLKTAIRNASEDAIPLSPRSTNLQVPSASSKSDELSDFDEITSAPAQPTQRDEGTLRKHLEREGTPMPGSR